jgi:hypothetical protein
VRGAGLHPRDVRLGDNWRGMLTEAVATVEELAYTAHVLAVNDDPSVRKTIVDYLGDNEVKVTALACPVRTGCKSPAGCARNPGLRSSC